jgi:hypothetical protein
VTRRSGRFGPYIQLGEGKEAKRASIPKDIPELDLEWALKLLTCRAKWACIPKAASRSPPRSAAMALSGA